jgi:DNA-binding NtrC family response regulator
MKMADNKLLDGKRVLAVDDEKDILDTLVDLLPMCELITASSFEEARELMDTQQFDLVILDIMGVDGYGLLETATDKKIPAVMLTAHAWSPDNLVKSIKEGAVSYLPKEELANITDYLNDVLTAKKEGRDPWASWHDRLPASYFERRWGAAWKDKDRQFWETFKSGLKAKRAAQQKED